MSTTAAEILEEKIDRMGRELRAADLVAGILRTLLGILTLLFVMAIIEHWTAIASGPGGTVVRWLVSILVYGVGGTLILAQIVRVLRGHVNPVYAAALIEDAEPRLRDSLINWASLRDQTASDVVSRRVFRSVETFAAQRLVTTENAVVVDRKPLIRLGIALTALMMVLCGYLLLSPKNPLTSFARILVPWADIAPPTRVYIGEIEPGDVRCMMGEWVTTVAELRGLRDDETPEVRISTMDGRLRDEPVLMRRREETAFKWEATMPAEGDGAQQSFDYWIVAGDATSRAYNVTVQVPLVAQVDAVTYDYPAFTGMECRRVVGATAGNIIAPEGTRITLEVSANRALASVSLEPKGISARSVPLRVAAEDPMRATGEWTIEADPESPDRPLYSAYRLHVTDTDGSRLSLPPHYQIRLIPNRLPKIEFVNPPTVDAAVPMSADLPLKVAAADPDYGLRDVTIMFEKEGVVFAKETLYDGDTHARGVDNPVGGGGDDTMVSMDGATRHDEDEGNLRVTRIFVFRGDRAGWNLRPGDRIGYRAVVRDLRVSDHGLPVATEMRSFTLVAPVPDRNGEREPNAGRNGEKDSSRNVGNTDSRTGNPMENQSENGADGNGTNAGNGNAAQRTGTEKNLAQNDEGDASEGNVNGGDAGVGERNGNEHTGGGADNHGVTSGDGSNAGQRGGAEKDGGNVADDRGASGGGAEKNNTPDGASGEQRSGGSQESRSGATGREAKAGSGTEKTSVNDAEKGAGGDANAPVDSKTDPGDAMERILDYAQQNPESNPGNENPNGNKGGKKDSGNTDSGKTDGVKPAGGGDGAGKPEGGNTDSGKTDGVKPASGGDEPGDFNSAEAAPEGTDPTGVQRSNDPRLSDAATQAAQQGAGTPSDERPDGGKSGGDLPHAGAAPKDAISTAMPRGGNGSERTASTQPVRPGDPKSQQELHPETANSPAPIKTPDATNGDGRNTGGTKPTDRPEPMDATGDVFRDETPDGTGRAGNRPDENGSQNRSTNRSMGTASDGKNGGDTGSAATPRSSAEASKSSDPAPGNAANGGGEQASNSASESGTPQTTPNGTAADGTAQPGNGPGVSNGPGGGNSNPGVRTGRGAVNNATGDLGADASREDYTRRNTELALRTLEESLKKDDPALLDRLGWSRDEAQAFLNRWRQIVAESGESGDAGRRAQQALGGLGLQSADPLSRRETRGAKLRELRQSGVVEAPAEWSDLYQIYRQGIGAGM